MKGSRHFLTLGISRKGRAPRPIASREAVSNVQLRTNFREPRTPSAVGTRLPSHVLRRGFVKNLVYPSHGALLIYLLGRRSRIGRQRWSMRREERLSEPQRHVRSCTSSADSLERMRRGTLSCCQMRRVLYPGWFSSFFIPGMDL